MVSHLSPSISRTCVTAVFIGGGRVRSEFPAADCPIEEGEEPLGRTAHLQVVLGAGGTVIWRIHGSDHTIEGMYVQSLAGMSLGDPGDGDDRAAPPTPADRSVAPSTASRSASTPNRTSGSQA